MTKENKLICLIIGLFLISGPFLAAQSATGFSKKALSSLSLDFNKSIKKIDKDINEVYSDKANKLVFTNSTRYKAIKRVYSRLFLLERTNHQEEKYIQLSSIALNNKHNPNLNRNKVFNLKQFNPLKYKLDFFPNQSTIYRIDNTNYILVILP